MGKKSDELDALSRGEGCIGKSQDDEPMFTIVARDVLSSETVRAWANMLVARGVPGNHPKVIEARACANEMESWRDANPDKAKVPD